MSAGERIVRNAAALTASRAAAMGLNFVVWVHLARVLEPERMGILGFGLSLVGFVVLGVTLGFDAVGTREVARAPDRVPEMVSALVSLRLALAVAAAVAYGIGVWAAPISGTYRAVLAVLGLQILARAIRLDWVYVGVERMGVVAVRDVAAAALAAAGALVLVRDADAVVMAAALVVAAPLLGTLGVWAGYRRDFGRLRLRADRAAWVTLFRPALPLAASAVMIEVYTNLDTLVLEGFRTTTEVGWYSVAYKAVMLALVPAAVLSQAFFARLSQALGDAEAMRQRGASYARATLAFGVPIALTGPWLAEPALVWLYGAPYAPAAPALALLLVNAGVIYVNMSLGTPLLAWDLQTPYMWIVASGAVANVVLNLALIPPYGIAGAAAATVASEAVVLVGLVRVYRRAVGAIPLGALLRPVPAALAGALGPTLWGLGHGWPVAATVAAGAAGYGVLAWATGVVDREGARAWWRARR